jgi:hypothetical protein
LLPAGGGRRAAARGLATYNILVPTGFFFSLLRESICAVEQEFYQDMLGPVALRHNDN